MKATLFVLASITAVLVYVSTGWGYSFSSRSVEAENGDYAKVTWPSEQKAEEHQGEDILTGSYNGTTYTITLNKENFPGMCSFPFGVHYGQSSRYVWVYTHNRANDGTTLVDVKTGKGLFGAFGHGSDVSSDGKRIAYTINGLYGLFYQACVQEFVVYPTVYQRLNQPNQSFSWYRPDNYPETPQMEVRHFPEWLDNDSMCFVHYDHPRMADLLRDETIKTQWFVRVDGVGDGFTTDSIRVRRAKLSQAEIKLLDEVQREKIENRSHNNNWPHEKLAQLCKARLQVVTPASFSRDPLDPEEFPIFPKDTTYSYKSPDGSHTINFSVTGEDTDTNCRVEIEFDDQHVGLTGELFPINRALRLPRWISNQKAQMVLQTNWYDQILYGYGEPKYWLVTVGLDDESTQPVAQTKAISEDEAKRMLDAQ